MVICFCYDELLINVIRASPWDKHKREKISRSIRWVFCQYFERFLYVFIYHAHSSSTALAITSSYDRKNTSKILEMKQDTFALN